MTFITNTLSLNLQNNLQKARFEDNIEKLASGKRINSARDDAAGLQISNRLETQLMVKGQTIRNLNDGISYGQTADAALDETTKMLQRMRTLAIQAANGSNTDADRAALNEEISALIAGLDYNANTTEIFGKYPLLKNDSNITNVPIIDQVLSNGVGQTFPSGYISLAVIPPGSTNVRLTIDDFGANDDLQLFDLNGNHIVGSTGSITPAAVEANLFTPANGFNGTETYNSSQLFDGGGYNLPAVNSGSHNGMTFTFSGNGNPGNRIEELIIDQVTEPLFLAVTGSGAFQITGTWSNIGSLEDSKIPVDNQMLVTAQDLAVGIDAFIDFPEINATALGLGISALNISTAADAQAVIPEIDAALARVGEHRAKVGAQINASESLIRNINNQYSSLSESKSRILDADYAQEMALKVKQDILTESTTSLMNQAVSDKSQLITSILNTVE